MLKTVYKRFAYNECDDFAKYLEQMALKGWHFKKWSTGLVFEKGEPEQAEYVVELFIKGSEYDTRPEPDTEEFADYYEAAGWKLIEAKRKYCIFKKCKEDAEETMAPDVRFEIIRKEMQGIYLGQFVAVALISIMRWWQLFTFDFENYVFDNYALFILIAFPILTVIALSRLIQHFVWAYKCKKKLQRGEKIIYKKQRDWYKWAILMIAIFWMIALISTKDYFVCAMMASVMAVTVGISIMIDKVRPSQIMNRMLQIILTMFIFVLIIVFAAGSVKAKREVGKITTPPLLKEDYLKTSGELEDKTVRQNSSILGNHIYCYLNYTDKSIFYDIYESEYEWIIEQLWKEESEKAYFKQAADCTEDWGAEKALRSPAMYLVKYENKLLLFISEELTEEQIAIVRDKLNLW